MGRALVRVIPAWVAGAAMLAGVLLSVTAGALPERWQEAGLYLGLGLTFATIGGVLLNLTMAARPEWRGAATVIGIVLGPLPLLIVARESLPGHPHSDALAPQSQAAAAPPPRQIDVALPPASPPAAPQARSEAASQAPGTQQQLDPVLAEVADILNNKARAALSRAVRALMRGRVRTANAEAVGSELDSAAHDMEEVRASLSQIQSRHKERQHELAVVIGDTAPLDELISKLHELRDSLQSAPQDDPLRRPGNDAGSVTTPVDRWIAACNQRILDQAKVLVSAS